MKNSAQTLLFLIKLFINLVKIFLKEILSKKNKFQLLNCFTIPVVMLFSCFFLSIRYMMSHIIGVAICLIGVMFVIYGDAISDSNLTKGKHSVVNQFLNYQFINYIFLVTYRILNCSLKFY